MEIKPLPPTPGQIKPRLVRLDDGIEGYALQIALEDTNGDLRPQDKPLWSYLGKITEGSYPIEIFTNAEQLGRILTGLGELITAAQKTGGIDGEAALRAIAETIRPFSDPPTDSQN